MAAARTCTFLFRQTFRVSTRRSLPLYSRCMFKGQRQLHVYLNTRYLSTGHALLTPDTTRPTQSNKTYERFRDEEEEDEFEVDEEDLEKLRQQHREEARAQHKAKEGITFKDFPINQKLLQKLTGLGYKEPFIIQTETLKHTLEGRDVIAKAVTGSGKTLCFAIPIVHKIAERPRNGRSRNPRAIVISPTRELCLQIHRSIQELDPRVKCVAVYGGERIERQEYQISRGCDVICATPGRLNDHLQRGLFGLGEVEFLCLDEADELLTPNFKDQIEDVLEGCPEERQMMLFSATIPKHIQSLTEAYMINPEVVDITKDQNIAGPLSVKHMCIKCEPQNMVPVLVTLLKEHKPERCIIFMETKRLTKDVTEDLRRCGAKAEFINSDLNQKRRENLMAAFRQGKVKMLVATDVAARGLDIPEIDLIIQVKPPTNGTDYYVHRSGRTGRAGRDGVAIMLHSGSPQEMEVVQEIQDMVPLEHSAPPDISDLEGIRFRTFIPFGFSGRLSKKPRGGYSKFGRSRYMNRNDSPRFSNYDNQYDSRGPYRDNFGRRDSFRDRFASRDSFGSRDSFRSRDSSFKSRHDEDYY